MSIEDYERIVVGKEPLNPYNKRVSPEVAKGALEAGRKTAETYGGPEKLLPESDFEWGMFSGKLGKRKPPVRTQEAQHPAAFDRQRTTSERLNGAEPFPQLPESRCLRLVVSLREKAEAIGEEAVRSRGARPAAARGRRAAVGT